jgi:hypothetical protein
MYCEGVVPVLHRAANLQSWQCDTVGLSGVQLKQDAEVLLYACTYCTVRTIKTTKRTSRRKENLEGGVGGRSYRIRDWVTRPSSLVLHNAL